MADTAVPASTGWSFSGDTGTWSSPDGPIATGPPASVPPPSAGGGGGGDEGGFQFSKRSGRSGESRLDKLWFYRDALALATQANTNLPSFEHSISVSVVGGPKAKLERIWALALSTAFGRYRQAGQYGIQAASLRGTWDITGKAVKVDLQYANSGVLGLLSELGPMAFDKLRGVPGSGYVIDTATSRTRSTADFLLTGPTQETVGGSTVAWIEANPVYAAALAAGAINARIGYLGGQAIEGLVPGVSIVAGIAGINIPKTLAIIKGLAGATYAGSVASAANAIARAQNPLPDTGRVITTAIKDNPDVQPPAPSGDDLSRTAPFLGLVANALTDPCYLPASPPQKKRKKKTPLVVPTSAYQSTESLNNGIKMRVETAMNLNRPDIYGQDGDKARWADDGYPLTVPEEIADLTGVQTTGV